MPSRQFPIKSKIIITNQTYSGVSSSVTAMLTTRSTFHLLTFDLTSDVLPAEPGVSWSHQVQSLIALAYATQHITQYTQQYSHSWLTYSSLKCLHVSFPSNQRSLSLLDSVPSATVPSQWSAVAFGTFFLIPSPMLHLSLSSGHASNHTCLNGHSRLTVTDTYLQCLHRTVGQSFSSF